MLTEYERRIALGDWGEAKALALLKLAGFSDVRDVNVETHHHPFGDIYAERAGERYLIGVKTRNKFQASGPLNATYNIKKNGMDVRAIAQRYNAKLAWVTLQVIAELQVYWSYFGTIAQIEENGVRFSVRMKPEETRKYECLAVEKQDSTINPAWSNGGWRDHRR
jgi:hypothetical protein